MATPLDPPGPTYPLNAAQAAWLGRPPKPLEPSVATTQSDGLPTREFALYLTQHYEWERKLYAVLTGIG